MLCYEVRRVVVLLIVPTAAVGIGLHGLVNETGYEC